MKLSKGLIVVAALVSIGLLAFSWARPAYGQGRAERRQGLAFFDGSGSQIGVTARDLEPAEAERLKDGGVYVESVRPDSPAEKAGLRAADVVVEFDGERVRSLRQFTRLVRETAPDRQVRATVVRDGRRTELSVTPAAGADLMAFDAREWRDQIEQMTSRIPPFDFNVDVQVARRDRRLGVQVQELTPDLAEFFGAKDGVLVASVTAESAAARAGVRAGDVITAVNGRPIASGSDLVRELRAVTGTGSVTLGIVRDKQASTVTATIDVQPERRARPLRQVRPIGL